MADMRKYLILCLTAVLICLVAMGCNPEENTPEPYTLRHPSVGYNLEVHIPQKCGPHLCIG